MGTMIDEGSAERLLLYEGLLRQRAVPVGLVAESDAARIYERHVLDCLRASAAFRSEDRTAYDLGSGAGLPGIVLACALPRCRFLLVEAKRRAVGFLELVVDRLRLDNAEILARRVEDLDGPADVATARAFAPLERAWAASWRLLRPGGRLVYFAGSGLGHPYDAARALSDPEPPGDVEVLSQVESAAPLVIMSRKG